MKFFGNIAKKKMTGDKMNTIVCFLKFGKMRLINKTAISNAIKHVVNTMIVQIINKIESKRSKKMPGIETVFESSNTG